MERRVIAIHGTVQGVGFRPYVCNLAAAHDLGGFVRNETGGVRIEVEGEADALDRFLARLTTRPPPLARIDDWLSESREPTGERGFRIDPSQSDARGPVAVTPDAATCDDCLAELFDPRDRRYRYPFLNCTNCGPRLTIIQGVPYDRERTTMSRFAMCPRCRAEYEDPTDRRFHAQPNACPVCGPRLSLLDAGGRLAGADEPLACFLGALRAGKIGAMKGLGGYHLVCDAKNPQAVAELRRRKGREEKPFAVMVADAVGAEQLCGLDKQSRELLTSPRRPIVLLRKHGATALADAVAPGNPYLGVMLPYTPLHHLLIHDIGGAPLVMTSGNRSDEPIAIDEADAVARLAGIADVFLTHDRPIHVRCDDSVTRIVGSTESPIRRSRGYAPQSVPLPLNCPQPILAVGGQLKATFALGAGRRAVLSHHLGDLDDFESLRAFEKDVALYQQLFSLRPALIAHDLHPDYASTRYARGRAEADGVRLVPVQHHHAHLASCMAENGLEGPVIGVTLDGTGYGTDGAIWGGEFLVGDYRGFRRAAHLRYVGMPGGEKAVREPWRMAVAHLRDAGADCRAFERRVPAASLRTVRRMLERRFNTPNTSSAGRLFDAVASLAGLRDVASFEGQAAMELEWAAAGAAPDRPYPFEISEAVSSFPSPGLRRALSSSKSGRGSKIVAPVVGYIESQAPLSIDTRPLIRAVAADVDAGAVPARVARRFHSTWVEIIATVCDRLRDETGLGDVVFSGGVFMNALLSVEAGERLAADEFRVYRHRLVPPNDGGLSLGQLAVAAAGGNDEPF